MTPEEKAFSRACNALLLEVDESIANGVRSYGESAIRAAVQAERARCAGIARDIAGHSDCPFDKPGFTLDYYKPCPRCRQTGTDARQGSACVATFPSERIADAIEKEDG